MKTQIVLPFLFLAFASCASKPAMTSSREPSSALGDGKYSFSDDFESGDFKIWNTDRLKGPYSAATAQDLVFSDLKGNTFHEKARSGNSAARFELREGDFVHDGYRTELKEKFYPPKESEQHYEISTLISPDYPLDEGSVCLLSQWHNVQDETKPDGYQYAREPVFANYYRYGALEVYVKILKNPNQYASPEDFKQANYRANDQTDKGDLVARIPDFKMGVWHDFVYEAKYSLTKGYLKGWVDGKQFVDYKGPLGYYDEPTGPYLKIGVYCKQEPRKPHVVFHDRYIHYEISR